MSLAIETEKLTKAYGRRARGIEDVDLAVGGRGLRFPRAQRGRQDHDGKDAARVFAADGWAWRGLRPRHQERECGDKGQGRQLAWGVRPGGQDDGRGASQV